ncbi:YPDG domain-containing protein, partial [Facklamia hominis]
MVGKNNIDALNRKAANKVNRYGIRRLSVGVASVAVAGLLFMSDATLVQAAGENGDAPVVENTSNVDPEVTLSDDQGEKTDDEGSNEHASGEAASQVEEPAADATSEEGSSNEKTEDSLEGSNEAESVDSRASQDEAQSKEVVNKAAEDSLEVSPELKPEAQKAGDHKAITEDQKKKAGQSANNWDEKITEDNDYWKAPEGYNKAKNMGGLSNGGMALNEVNYLGTYTDETGRDVIRLEWKGDSRTSESVWMDQLSLAFKFQKDLYEKIDWDRSYVYSTSKGEQKFLFNNVNAADYQAEFMLSQITGSYTGNLYELPMNLVLKEGVKISDLGRKDYLVQHRGYDTKYKEILANFPGTVGTRELNDVEYSQFTKTTVIPLNSNLHNDIIPANSNKESNRLSYGSSEYDSEKKVIKAKHYYRKSDSIDSYLGNVGFTQSFDARLLDLLKEDEYGNVAYLNVNGIGDEKAYKDTPKVGIKRNQINVKNGVATIYVVGSSFESNLDKTGNKVVRATSGNITTGIYSTLFKTATINYVNTTIEYNVDEDMISKLFPQNKYLQAYAFQSGFIHENKDGFLKSEQEVKEDTVIDKGSKLTLEFKDQMKDKGNQYVMQIGDTYHIMNDNSAPHRASDFETITERNAGGIGSARNMKYDIDMKAGRTLSAGEKIRLWIVNDNGHKYESQSWRLYINTGNAETDKDIVNVEGDNFEKDYNPYYFQHSKSVDGVMVTKYKHVPQVEEIFDTDKEIVGTVRRDENSVTGYYMSPDGEKFYFSTVESANEDGKETIILDENGRRVEEGDRKYEEVYKYALAQLKSEDGKENLKLKKDMPIYLNNSRKGQFPSDPVVEKVKARVTFDQNYEGKPEDTVVVAPENKQYLGNAGYTPNGLDYNGKNVMPEDPTREGYTFVGWATTPDATEANFTKDTAIENSLTVYAIWKKAEITDDFTPSYTDADGQVGTQTTITAPNFTDKDGQPTTKPEGTKFALGKGAPAGAKINEETGEITYTPTKEDAGKDINIPVIVTYPDDSTDEVSAKISVVDETPVEKTENPTITAPKAGDKEITGKSEPNAKVEVELPDGTKVET